MYHVPNFMFQFQGVSVHPVHKINWQPPVISYSLLPTHQIEFDRLTGASIRGGFPHRDAGARARASRRSDELKYSNRYNRNTQLWKLEMDE